MRQVAQFLFFRVNGKVALVATVLFLLFMATVLPWISSLSTELIGVSESIDTSFNFNPNHIYSIVDSYGAEGRRIYIILRWTFDVIFPLVYTLFLVSITAFIAKKITCLLEERVLYIAIVAMGFDFLENILATIVMAIYPTQIDVIVYLLILASLLKWTMLGLAFVVPFVLLGRLTFQQNPNS